MFLLVLVAALEVIGPKVLISLSVLEHVVDGSEDRGGDGDDRLLRTAPRLEVVELGAQVSVLLAHRRPGALHQCGLEPRRTLAQAIGAALAGALIVARTDAGPGDEVAVGREPVHVDADLGDDHLGGKGLDARGRAQLFDGGTKGRDIALYLLIDLGDGGFERIDLLEM